MQAREIIAPIVTSAIKLPAKQAGYKRHGFHFHRRSHNLTHVFHVQLARSNFGSEGQFYINVGIHVDQLSVLEQTPINHQPKYTSAIFRQG